MPVCGHWLKAPNRRTVMNFDKRWLRQGPPETVEAVKGRSMNQAVAMLVDSVNATISGVILPKPFIGGKNMGNMAPNKVVDKQLPIGNQLIEKSSSGTAVVVDGDMESDKDFENGPIVNYLKRRRSLNGLHITMGLGEESSTTNDTIEVAKNGPAMGLVFQAHRAQ